MSKLRAYFRNNYSIIYKGFLLLISLMVIVSFFPKEATYKYEYAKGRPWMHDDLIAPFDFAIQKSPEEVTAEKNALLENMVLYFDFNTDLVEKKRSQFIEDFNLLWGAKYGTDKKQDALKQATMARGLSILSLILTSGVVQPVSEIDNKPADYEIMLILKNTAERVKLSDLYTIHSAYEAVNSLLRNAENVDQEILKQLLHDSIIQNVFFNENVTKIEHQKQLDQISTAYGMVQNGERIISKGEVITKEKFQILESMRAEVESKLGGQTNYLLVLAGQILLVSISLIVLVFFLHFFRKDILSDNKKVLFILLIIVMMVFVTSQALRFGFQYIYVVPLCLSVMIIRVFFDTRLALYVYIITIINIGFLVPNSFQFVFMQLISGIITIFTIVNLQKRSQFFFSAFIIFLSYSAIYTGLTLLQEGNINAVKTINYAMFAGSALLLLFAYPIIYVLEKIFGLVTDVTLMELSDTNSPLLRELSMKAPGTFQHSLQVANLSEECIFAIGGDALLTRTGALYHDIGKMDQPMFFIENQVTGVNPHDEVTFEESASIIINHVIKGIEKAKKNKLPEQIIDFIRTHHGTRKVEYFFVMEKKENPDEIVDEQRFTYPGPIPFSKETSVVMMADSVEAASRSLKIIDEKTINDLVENIINKQVETGQFINSNITLRDISKSKKILKKKLMNIYHIRIEYPE